MKGRFEMVNPLNLHNEIVGNILRNFPNQLSFPQNRAANRVASTAATDNNTSESAGAVRESERSTISFSEALAQRLEGNVHLEEDELRRIINEEVASVVDRTGGSDLLAMLIHQGNDAETMLNSLSLYSTMMRGLNRINFNPLASMAMSQGDNLPFTSATSALIGMSNPLDALRMYGSMLGLQRTNSFNTQQRG
jgi:hypothetical protein